MCLSFDSMILVQYIVPIPYQLMSWLDLVIIDRSTKVVSIYIVWKQQNLLQQLQRERDLYYGRVKLNGMGCQFKRECRVELGY